MKLGHLTDQKLYSDKDMIMLSCYVGDVMYSICSKKYSSDYMVQCTKLGIFFKTDNPDMAHRIMKMALGEH